MDEISGQKGSATRPDSIPQRAVRSYPEQATRHCEGGADGLSHSLLPFIDAVKPRVAGLTLRVTSSASWSRLTLPGLLCLAC